MENLRKANRVRSGRSKVKKELKRGDRTLGAVLEDLPECLETMRVFDLLISCPKVGRVKANAICRRLGIRPSLYLPQLSDARRKELVLAAAGRLSSPGRYL